MPYRILVIEDNADLVNHVIKPNLEREGMIVTWASSGTEGLDMAKAGNYDCVLLDVNFPDGKDGLDVCRELKQTLEDLPVIFVTIRKDPAEIGELWMLRPSDVVYKPFEVVDLVRRVKARIRENSSPTGSSRVLRFHRGSVNLDTGENTGGPDLTGGLELSLLTHLHKNMHRYCSKKELRSLVWRDMYTTDDAIEKLISVVRSKIGPGPTNHNYIINKPGMGYRLVFPDANPK